MSTADASSTPNRGQVSRTGAVIVLGGAMLAFISFWRVAAVVLCDLASTAYYIGGIVEQAVGPAAPWFILAVMIFSYAVRAVYIESSAMFVRGGVYRVVKEAMGGLLAKISVSALMFDYVLTGPISAVSAGQYIMGLALETAMHLTGQPLGPEARDAWKRWGSVGIACLVTVYFFRENLIGMRESSGKALRIMAATTIMAAVLLTWCGLTLFVIGPRNWVPHQPDLAAKPDPSTGELVSPLGFLNGTALGDRLAGLHGHEWLSLIGLVGLFIAFGHSVLAMSGEETLAQVYREVEAPKLPNFKKAAFIVFIYSLVLTAGVSFLAVLLIPGDVRMKDYADNLIGGLAMNVWGPAWARLALNGFVVVVGFLILSGAVNTAMIGSNGVLNRVAEDGVMPDWFLRPHPRHGTTYRVLWLIFLLQIFTILVSRGDVLALGEAYAFGVVWSFVFKALAMIVLRFKEPGRREFKVPLNIRVGLYDVPVGLSIIFLILLVSALANLLTKPVATEWGLGFTAAFLCVFLLSERYHRRFGRAKREHLEQFTIQMAEEINPESLGLSKPYRMLVCVRSTHDLQMLERVLKDVNPETTDLVVLCARVLPHTEGHPEAKALSLAVQRLMTAVVERAEKAGKEVHPLVVETNDIWHAIANTSRALRVQEVVLGGTRPSRLMHQLRGSPGQALTVRVVDHAREWHVDLGGGNPIPRAAPQEGQSPNQADPKQRNSS
jgi:amino acid transporter